MRKESRFAQKDLQELLNEALNLAEGGALKITKEDPGGRAKAAKLVAQLNKVRMTSRKDSKEIFPPEHPLYDASAWDILEFSRPKGSNIILISKRVLESFDYEIIDLKRAREIINQYKGRETTPPIADDTTEEA